MSNLRQRVAGGLKIGAIALCALFALRGRPPAGAQRPEISGTNGLSVEDQLQDQAIADLRERTDKFDSREDQHKSDSDRDIRDLRSDLNDSRVETRIEFGGIGLLYGGGLVADRRRKKSEGGAG